MKIKQTVWLINPVKYIKTGEADIGVFYSADSEYFREQGYMPLHEIEVDVQIDEKVIVLTALENLDEKETGLRAEFNRKLREIESARNDLKALSYEKSA